VARPSHSYEFVQESCCKRDIELLSKQYLNNKEKLECRCVKCNHIWFISFGNIMLGHGCPECDAQTRRHTYEYVKQYYLDRNIKLLSLHYVNNKQRLECQCLRCGYVWLARFDGVVSKGYGCSQCAGLLSPSVEKVEKFLEEKKLIWVDKVYVNSKLPLKCICKICSQECAPSYNSLLKQGGCQFCGFLAGAKTQNDAFEFVHWKTGQKLSGKGNYERAVVNYRNKNQLDYQWQPKKFNTPFKTKTGKVSIYIPDMYIEDLDLWVEIKGWFRSEKSRQKWEWFHKEHPNSEIWFQKELQEKGIL